MTNAYDEAYLGQAMYSLSSMLEYVKYDLQIPVEEFYNWFLQSGIAGKFGRGQVCIIAGRSGIELARDVIWLTKREEIETEPGLYMDKSAEYWAGWVLCYYQWYSGRSFQEIQAVVPISDVVGMYHPYHEMDLSSFVEAMEARFYEQKRSMLATTSLKRMRLYANMTQKQLAASSGVPLRTIQQYEQRQKNINKAAADSVQHLAAALGCESRELLEA